MKVLGINNSNYPTKYIAEVSHTELEKYLNQYYIKPKLETLVVGQEIDLSKGYEYKKDADEIYRKITEVFGKNNETLTALNRAVELISPQE